MEPLCSVLILEEDAHSWRCCIGVEVIEQKSVVLYTDLLDFGEGNRPIPIPDELLPQDNLLIKAVKVWLAIHFPRSFERAETVQFFSA